MLMTACLFVLRALWQTWVCATEWNMSSSKWIPPQFPRPPLPLSHSLLAAPRNKQNHREDRTHSLISQMLMDSLLFSPLHSPTFTFRSTSSICQPPSLSGNDITLSIDSSPISPSALAELLELQETGHISSSVAKQVSQPQAPHQHIHNLSMLLTGCQPLN